MNSKLKLSLSLPFLITLVLSILALSFSSYLIFFVVLWVLAGALTSFLLFKKFQQIEQTSEEHQQQRRPR